VLFFKISSCSDSKVVAILILRQKSTTVHGFSCQRFFFLSELKVK